MKPKLYLETTIPSELANKIIESGIIPAKSVIDATHIAIAAVHEMEYLLTWNCTHIANAEISNRVRDICQNEGFKCPVICTPEELMGGEADEK